MTILSDILGILQDYQFRLVAAEFLFLPFLPRRSFFFLRVLVFLPILLVPLAFNDDFQQHYFLIGNYNWSFLLWFLLSILAMVFSFKTHAEQYAYIAVMAYTIQNLFANYRFYLYYAFFEGEYTLTMQILGLLGMIIIYVSCYFLLVRKWLPKFQNNLSINKRNVFFFSIAVLLIVNVLSSIFTTQNGLQMADLCLIFGIVSILLLIIQNSVYDRSYFQYEKETLEHVLAEDDRQRKFVQENMERMNIRLHDFKHQLLALKEQGAEGKLIQETLEEVSAYDSHFDTGNESLNVVLNEKNLLLRKEGVRFSCIADGKALGKMAPKDIYSLFGNAIDNAIECLSKCPMEKRNLTLNIQKVKAYVRIRVENYP